jgi:hypothetical protein
MIIGLSGYARSGKDTVAKVLIDNYGFTRVAFADKIREMLLDINPYVGVLGMHQTTLVLSDLIAKHGWEHAKSNPEVRRLLQELGVSARHHLGDDVWINAALNTPAESENLVITDVRFMNEADAIKRRGGQVWRVMRPGVKPVNSHISEKDLDAYSFDGFILNDGSIEDLEAKVLNLIPSR